MTIYLGENIKRLRREKGMTQETLAEFLSVSFQSISRWERGESYPDITLLPLLSKFFGVTVDELLGMNEAKDEEKIKEYLELYDNMKLKDLPFTLENFKEAIKEFPRDFRILIRYMELLQEEKGIPNRPDYEKVSKELMSLYEYIQKHCTDDSIRIWSKRIIINHLLIKYQCTCNEDGKYYVFDEYLNKAKEIIYTLPSLSDTREMLLGGLANDSESYYSTARNLIEELLFYLQESTFGYFLFRPIEDRINAFLSQLNFLDLLYTDGDYGKNCFNRLYSLGHLGHLYHKAGDDKKTFEYLKLAVEYAKELDSMPEFSEKMMRYYNLGTIYRETNATEFMKIVMTEHYELSDEFKATDEFKEILSLLG